MVKAWMDLHTTLRANGINGISEMAYPNLVMVMTQPYYNTSPITSQQAMQLFYNLTYLPGLNVQLQTISI